MLDSSKGILALVQARMSSKRLPGKVLMPCGQGTFLSQQLKRISSSKNVRKVVVLTSSDDSDEAIVDFCTSHDTQVFRGNLHDVFQRFYDFLEHESSNLSHFARLTADCPFICSDLIDDVAEIALQSDFDYVSNTLEPTFPDGMDVEVIKIESFLNLKGINLNSYEREHVTPGIYFRPGIYSLANLTNSLNLSHYRWTLDTLSDATFLSKISNEFPEIVTNPSYRKIKELILDKGNYFPKTDTRKPISEGPWIEYSYSYD